MYPTQKKSLTNFLQANYLIKKQLLQDFFYRILQHYNKTGIRGIHSSIVILDYCAHFNSKGFLLFNITNLALTVLNLD